jgi:hypothetical protein
MIVTAAPNSRKRQANSHPTAPPPTTAMEAGTRSRDSARSESKNVPANASKGGGKNGADPVAITAASKGRRSVPPVVFTATVAGSAKDAAPSTTRTPSRW